MENVNQNFSLDSFMESQIIVNRTLSRSNQDITKAIEYFSTTLDEIVGNYKKLDNKIQIIKKDNEELQNEIELSKEELNTTKEELNTVKDKIDVIEFDDSSKLGELKKSAKIRVMKFTGDRTNPKYILFFRPYISKLYSNVTKNLNGGKRLGKIKTEDFDVALKLIKRWCPTSNYTNKLLNDYLKSKVLSQEKEKALELYLDEVNGGRM